MSIELCSPTPKYPKIYHVRPNRCDCHPETCCCNDWVVYDGNGERDLDFFRKSDAQEWADTKNKAAEV